MTTRLLAILAAAALALTGCGTDADPATEATPTTAATSDTAPPDTGTAPGADADPQAIAAAVDTTLEAGSAAFTAQAVLDSAELSETFTSNGVVDFTGARRQASIETFAGPVDVLVREDGILLSVPFGDEGGWVRGDPRDLRGTPLEAYGLATLPLQDPSVNLQLLRGATDDVRDLGEEGIDDDATRRYAVTVDVGQAAQQTSDPQAREALEEAARDAGQNTIEMEVWIDAQQRIRRVQQTVDLARTEFATAAGTQAEGTLVILVDLREFGTAVDIAEPTDDEIIDLDAQSLEALMRQVTPEGLQG